jgi:hypothetical protein
VLLNLHFGRSSRHVDWSLQTRALTGLDEINRPFSSSFTETVRAYVQKQVS